MLSPELMATSRQHRRARAKFSFRSFYISTLLLCTFALVSLVTTQVARYKNGDQYGIVQRRAVADLDTNRLLKRDEEVSNGDKLLRPIANTSFTVPARPFRRR